MLSTTKAGLERYIASHLGLDPDNLSDSQRKIIANIMGKMKHAATEALEKEAREIMRR